MEEGLRGLKHSVADSLKVNLAVSVDDPISEVSVEGPLLEASEVEDLREASTEDVQVLSNMVATQITTTTIKDLRQLLVLPQSHLLLPKPL